MPRGAEPGNHFFGPLLGGDSLGRFALGLHEIGAVRLFGGELIVRPASESQIRDRRLTAAPERNHVIEFQEPEFGAAMAVLTDEGAAATVALMNRTSQSCRHVFRIPVIADPRGPRLVGRAELA